jgi:hypothetical protein
MAFPIGLILTWLGAALLWVAFHPTNATTPWGVFQEMFGQGGAGTGGTGGTAASTGGGGTNTSAGGTQTGSSGGLVNDIGGVASDLYSAGQTAGNFINGLG